MHRSRALGSYGQHNTIESELTAGDAAVWTRREAVELGLYTALPCTSPFGGCCGGARSVGADVIGVAAGSCGCGRGLWLRGLAGWHVQRREWFCKVPSWSI